MWDLVGNPEERFSHNEAHISVACETLYPVDNGVINITTDGSTTQATYTCESGFSLKGFSLLTCRSDGAWDFSPPVCGEFLLELCLLK